MKKFADWIVANDKKQTAVAKAIGVSTSTMHNLVNTDRIPQLHIAIKIEKYTKREITVYDWDCDNKETKTKKKTPPKTARKTKTK